MSKEICLEPIEALDIMEDGKEVFSGHYYCQKPKGHGGFHAIIIPQDPEYWQAVKDEEEIQP